MTGFYKEDTNYFDAKQLTISLALENGFLGGPHNLSFNIQEGKKLFKVDITQMGIRKISISSSEPEKIKCFINIFEKLYKLMMLFDGKFIPIEHLNFIEGSFLRGENTKEIVEGYFNNRITYYNSVNFLWGNESQFINLFEVLTQEVFEVWVKILEELDIVHDMIMYNLTDNKLPVDFRCAFMIEIAEPVIELVSSYKKCFVSIKHKKNNTLKTCLNVLISQYGEVVFKEEINNNYENILAVLVNSRVRIMHIKRKQKKRFLSGEESILYIIKMFCLYRIIVFDLLDIEKSKYQRRVEKYVNTINRWEGVLDKLIKQK